MNCLPEAPSSDDGFSDDDYSDFKQNLKDLQRERIFNMENEKIDPELISKQAVYGAIPKGELEIVRTELDKGEIDVEVDLRNGWTPLLLAASVGNPLIAAELVRRRAKVNAALEGKTVLMFACECNEGDSMSDRLETVRILVENGAEVNAVDRRRKTAIMYAAYTDNLEVVKYLLPLCNKGAEDNQRWTALFWAVEGRSEDVVKYLLDEEFNYNKKDIRNNTPKIIAEQNGFHDIADLFPEENATPMDYIINNHPIDFERTFESGLLNNQRPHFFEDICKMLYGVRCESLAPVLQQKNIKLDQFLSVSEAELIDYGIQMPYQRNRILSGLYRFHKHPYHPRSLPFIGKHDLISNIDVSMFVLSAIKQLTCMECSLKFIKKNGELSSVELEEITSDVIRIKQQIRSFKGVIERLMEDSKMWDKSIPCADLIKKKHTNIPWRNLMVFACISVFAIYKFYR